MPLNISARVPHTIPAGVLRISLATHRRPVPGPPSPRNISSLHLHMPSRPHRPVSGLPRQLSLFTLRFLVFGFNFLHIRNRLHSTHRSLSHPCIYFGSSTTVHSSLFCTYTIYFTLRLCSYLLPFSTVYLSNFYWSSAVVFFTFYSTFYIDS